MNEACMSCMYVFNASIYPKECFSFSSSSSTHKPFFADKIFKRVIGTFWLRGEWAFQAVYHHLPSNVTSWLITHIMVNLQLIIIPSFLINFSLSDWSCHFASMLLFLSVICDHYAKGRTAGRHRCHLQSCTKASEGAC